MVDNQAVQNRKRLRAEGYDYSQPGWYFVTICTQHRVCLFGHIARGTMHHSTAGDMVADVVTGLSKYFENVEIDPFVVMPNHVHAIIKISPVNYDVSPYALSEIVASFKLHTTHRYIKEVRDSGWKSFPGKLWQRSFHDRIIRNDHEAGRLHEYIEANPQLWEKDTHYMTENDLLP